MPFLRRYNTLTVTGTTAIRIPIVKRGVVDFAIGADWTPATGDVKILVDGTAAANVTNLPTAIAGANTGAVWEFILTAAELSCKQCEVVISDASTKAIEDQCFSVETFGNASAMYQADFSAANIPANVTQLLGTAWLTPGTAGTPDVNVKLWNALSTVALPLVPTTAGRTLDVSTGGEAGLDWANVGSPTTTVDLSGTTIKTTQKVDVDTIKTNPVINAGTITFPTTATLASTTNITAGTVTTATNVTNVNGLAANVITAAATATDFGTEVATAIWTDTTAGDFTTALSVGKSIMNGVSLGTGLTINAYTGNTVQTGDSFARIGAAGAGLTNIDLPNQTMDITGNITGNLSGSVGSVTGAVGSVTGSVGSVTGAVGSVTGAVGSVTGNIGGNLGGTLTSTERNAISDALLARALVAESYAADGAVPTLSQVLYLIQQTIGDFSITGTTITVKKMDGSTTAATYTLDSATVPTSRTRAT